MIIPLGRGSRLAVRGPGVVGPGITGFRLSPELRTANCEPRAASREPRAAMIGFRRARANRRRRGRRKLLGRADAGFRQRLRAASGAAARAARPDPSDGHHPRGESGAVAAQRELYDHGPPRSGEPNAHRRAAPHLAQHLVHPGHQPPLPSLLQRVAEHAVDVDARGRARGLFGPGRSSGSGLGVDRCHQPEARRHERSAG